MASQLAQDLGNSDLVKVDNSDLGKVDMFLRLAAVMRATGLGRSTIYDLVAAGLFPRPVKIGNGKAVAWAASEVAQWQRDRMAARGAPR